MKKYIIFCLLIFASMSVFAQKVYVGNTIHKDNVYCNIKNGYIYLGDPICPSKVLAYFDGKYIFEKESDKVLYTYSNGYIYRGRSLKKENLIGEYKCRLHKLYTYEDKETYVIRKRQSGETSCINDDRLIFRSTGWVHPLVWYFIINHFVIVFE